MTDTLYLLRMTLSSRQPSKSLLLLLLTAHQKQKLSQATDDLAAKDVRQ